MTPDEQAKLEATNAELRTYLEKALNLLALPAVQMALQLEKARGVDVTSTAAPVDEGELLRRATHPAPAAVPTRREELPVISADDGDTSAARERAMQIVMPTLFSKGARERVQGLRSRD